MLKGFLDRVLVSGFAFEESLGGTSYRGLLEPRSARVVTTMDTHWLVYRRIYGPPGELAMKRGTLGFCGLSHRGLGEFDVCLTHSLGVILFGYSGVGWIVLPQGAWLLWRLFPAEKQIENSQRIDGKIAIALLFTFSFSSFDVISLFTRTAIR